MSKIAYFIDQYLRVKTRLGFKYVQKKLMTRNSQQPYEGWKGKVTYNLQYKLTSQLAH